MDTINILIFGMVQGLSEFLPISSSGHLVLLNRFLALPHYGPLFVLVLHLGTLMVILSHYQKELFSAFSQKGRGRLMALLVTATIPGVGGAFFLSPFIKESLSDLGLTGLGFILTGFCLFLTARFCSPDHTEKSVKDFSTFPFQTAFFMGIAQVLAFFPGMSRAGWTICCALFLKTPQKQAVFFSFLMAVPAIVGAIIIECLKEPLPKNVSFKSLGLAFLISFLAGKLALKVLIFSLKKKSFFYFAFYLWPLGFLTLYISLFYT